MNKILYFLLIPLLIIGNACNNSHASHWGYNGEEGPSHWSELSVDFIQCVEGHSQSPIDFNSDLCEHHQDPYHLQFHYVPSVLDVVNNGHTEQVNCLTNDEIDVEGHAYRLSQFHFHTPSEHTLDGVHFPMEIHFVHKDSAGQIAVVGILVESGKHNLTFDPILSHLPKHSGEHDVVPVPINPSDLFPENQHTFRYEGSLTTPPCSEHVHWMVFEEHIQMSADQIQAFQRIFPHNNRPVQPLNDRTVSVID
ncbi:UNVERIFIED_CONTAM: hypothetical protein GTU68_040977 [Idotea baltica]|nr:hypothetical protein [Idotea baltica]